MTEGRVGGGGLAGGCKWCLYRGCIQEKIAFTPITKALITLLLLQGSSGTGMLLRCAALSALTAFINCDNTHYSTNDSEAARFPPRFPLSSQNNTDNFGDL